MPDQVPVFNKRTVPQGALNAKKLKPAVPLFGGGPGQAPPAAAGAPEAQTPPPPKPPAANKEPEATDVGSSEPEPVDDAVKTLGAGDFQQPDEKEEEKQEESASDTAEGSADGENGKPSKKEQMAKAAEELLNQQGSQDQQSVRTQVYGLDYSGRSQDRQKRAIMLRMEPLKPNLKEFEGVLGEERQTVTIGGNRKVVDLFVNDEMVSKKHLVLCVIGVHNELALAVVDHSTNGTYINGKKIPQRQKRFRVRSGDKITLKDPRIEDDCGWKLDFGNTTCFFVR
eukprot:gnl/MRDRNA2_/MRDRNA2_109420_c0_seq1.p1 gnl/MRDRNA2_/MRDRNA2_109420_c0~~gnl/MRDRNA2_/MRDRNA2_109420_c0_seq1.p1  ORF type:complete len:308 (-),score=85.42 gnl/MRDRNA2_/MRDRNA2_109420_c0_seq1:46-894(-)